MSWAVSLLVAVLSGVASLFLAGFIADACVVWFRISSREGGAGYFVVFTALLGGVAGTILGLIMARIVVSTYGPGFAKELGGSLASILVVAGGIALVARLLGDVPPTIEGRDLVLEVEFRFPNTENGDAPPTSKGEWGFTLSSVVSNTVRKRWRGEIHNEHARFELGQWIVPATVGLFTERGGRLVTIVREGSVESIGFLLPIPRHPRRNLLGWSEWIPKQQLDGRPWPTNKASCRYRIRKTDPPPPRQSQREYDAEQAGLKESEFLSIPLDAPLTALFPYLEYPQPQTERAVQRLAERKGFAEEIGKLLVGEDPVLAAAALQAVAMHPAPTEDLIPFVQAAGREIAARIAKFNGTSEESDPGFELAVDPTVRFHRWIDAVAALRERCRGDFIPELTAILELSRARPESHAMRADVNRVASYYLHKWAGVEPLPTDPKPR